MLGQLPSYVVANSSSGVCAENFHSLQNLILSSNLLSKISHGAAPSFATLQRLEISSNRLAGWDSVDALNQYGLTSLWIDENPFQSGQSLSTSIVRDLKLILLMQDGRRRNFVRSSSLEWGRSLSCKAVMYATRTVLPAEPGH